MAFSGKVIPIIIAVSAVLLAGYWRFVSTSVENSSGTGTGSSTKKMVIALVAWV